MPAAQQCCWLNKMSVRDWPLPPMGSSWNRATCACRARQHKSEQILRWATCFLGEPFPGPDIQCMGWIPGRQTARAGRQEEERTIQVAFLRLSVAGSARCTRCEDTRRDGQAEHRCHL